MGIRQERIENVGSVLGQHPDIGRLVTQEVGVVRRAAIGTPV